MLASFLQMCRNSLTDDKKGVVDRSTTVIAKEPEGNLFAFVRPCTLTNSFDAYDVDLLKQIE